MNSTAYNYFISYLAPLENSSLSFHYGDYDKLLQNFGLTIWREGGSIPYLEAPETQTRMTPGSIKFILFHF